ncbi:hypothetical protein NCY59_03630 [Acinetobacter radioresistens]|uniref:hypothetical protein n=1 Tax=Acinetobacter radioresistens TaxID=40216 RepID=UPI00202FBADF|nr:hypothetical protein [Acinetobacter radioresistens]MCM1934582.1 hypothetical protein [Acinetobacter radioresistens]MCM1952131.1 hypothetical protein [Acinetobacter radioresistens]MCU4517698.1 hypothetical protein [Acinetobacter radioresistens]
MDIKEKQAFDEYFQEKYPELYKDVFNEDGDERAIIGYSFALSAWQARAKAQAVPELTDKMIVAIESEVESQLKASAIDADPFRLDGEKIWYAALEAQEST